MVDAVTGLVQLFHYSLNRWTLLLYQIGEKFFFIILIMSYDFEIHK